MDDKRVSCQCGRCSNCENVALILVMGRNNNPVVLCESCLVSCGTYVEADN
jgi:uncharacterized Zn finger protein